MLGAVAIGLNINIFLLKKGEVDE